MATSRAALKNYFKTNFKPTEGQFAELIDSAVHSAEDIATNDDMQAGLDIPKYINPKRVKQAVEFHSPVKSVKTINGNAVAGTGDITIIPGQAKLFTFVKDEFVLPNADTVLQPIFDSPMDEFAVGLSRTYRVTGKYLILCGTGSRQVRLGWSVTTDLMGTFAYTTRFSRATSTTALGTSAVPRFINGVATTAVSSTITDPFAIVEIDGVLRTNKDGIFKPLIQLSATSGDVIRILPGSYLELTDIGNASIDRSPGVS